MRLAAGTGFAPPDCHVTTEVQVRYAADDPQEARVSSWKLPWPVPAMIATVVLLPMLIGVLLVCAVWRKAGSRVRSRSRL
jgi:hypothetical protein